MVEAYVFGPHARLELMEGELVEMAPISSAHASVVNTLAAVLRNAISRAIISVQDPLVLSDRSMVQPDVVLLRSCADRYVNSHPIAADALLVVEVADRILEDELEVKRQLYARARIAGVWIVDVDRRELHVLRGPEQNYSIYSVLSVGDDAAVAALGDVSFAVASLFQTCNADDCRC